MHEPQPTVMAVSLPEFAPAAPAPEPRDIAAMAGTSLNVRVVAGSTTMTLSEVRALEPGSIVPLDVTPGSQAAVYINDVRAARAEVIVVDDKLAARISEIEGADRG